VSLYDVPLCHQREMSIIKRRVGEDTDFHSGYSKWPYSDNQESNNDSGLVWCLFGVYSYRAPERIGRTEENIEKTHNDQCSQQYLHMSRRCYELAKEVEGIPTIPTNNASYSKKRLSSSPSLGVYESILECRKCLLHQRCIQPEGEHPVEKEVLLWLSSRSGHIYR